MLIILHSTEFSFKNIAALCCQFQLICSHDSVTVAWLDEIVFMWTWNIFSRCVHVIGTVLWFSFAIMIGELSVLLGRVSSCKIRKLYTPPLSSRDLFAVDWLSVLNFNYWLGFLEIVSEKERAILRISLPIFFL